MTTAAVVIPVYATPENHRLDFLGQALQSVQQQTHHDLVAVVVDDGSTADVGGLVSKFGDGRLRYVRRTRLPTDLRTASNALNFGINLCIERNPDVLSQQEASDLAAIAYLHSDDILPPESIGRRFAALTPDAAFVYAETLCIDSANRPVSVWRWKGKPGSDMFYSFPHHTVMWTAGFAKLLQAYAAEKFRQDGIFDSGLSHGEDRDASASSMDAALSNGRFPVYVPFCAYIYRQHRQTITGSRANSSYLNAQRRRVNAKHFSSSEFRKLERRLLFERAVSDFPWSLGYGLPEPVKLVFRPIRLFAKRQVAAMSLSSDERHSLDCLLAMQPLR